MVTDPTNDAERAPLQFELPIRYHVSNGMAWDDENPAKGFKGTTTGAIELTTANTAVACMHCGNYCYPGGIEWGPDARFSCWTKNVANLPRIRKIIEERIAPLLEVIRSKGMRVIYLVEGWPTAERYPQYRELRDRVTEPQIDIPRSPNVEWRKEFLAELRGPEWRTRAAEVAQVLDMAPTIQPEPLDWVATTTAQASTVLAENGIWNLLYTGFDTTGCVCRSAGGMWPMSKLGYRTILLRDCSAGAETAETFPTEGLTKAWIQVLEIHMATAVSSDLLEAIRDAANCP